MPKRTSAPSARTHSWSSEYLRSSGTFTAGDDTPQVVLETSGGSAQQAADAPHVLVRSATGVAVAAGLGPDVGDRLLGVGQRQGPAVVVEHLHAVDEHELAVGLLHQRAHHRALLLPRRAHRLVDDVGPRQRG